MCALHSARYFFHVHVIDGESQVDDIGADFPSDARAIDDAHKFVRDIMVEAAEGGTCLTYVVEVTDRQVDCSAGRRGQTG